ncbi:MAG TPA: hypothetical protein VMK66_18240 [Myxococcales bacterium]|nr:hypothetical protein [Myxococcales bacterium]
MRNGRLIALLFLPLLGCYAQIEAPSVTMTHNLCGTTDCMPGLGASLTVWQVSGANTFSVSFGDQPLLNPTNSVGPTTVNTSLLLNQGEFDMITTGAGADFSGVNTVDLYAVNPGVSTAGDPCATPANCTKIASFNKTTDGAANRQLVLKGNGSDLAKLIDTSTHTLSLEIRPSGNAPTPALWNAQVSMDMSLTSRANLP